jgi:hypothetical protein
MKGTGKFLFQRYLVRNHHAINENSNDGLRGRKIGIKTQRQRRRRVKFVSDNAPRDVQTALAIMTGILEEDDQLQLLLLLQQQQQQNHLQTLQQYDDNSPPIQGLHNIQLEPDLFTHFDSKQQPHDICALPPKVDTIRVIEDRLRSIPPPQKLVEIMEWMERKTGKMDLFQPFFDDDDDDDKRNHILLTTNGDHFQGGG